MLCRLGKEKTPTNITNLIKLKKIKNSVQKQKNVTCSADWRPRGHAAPVMQKCFTTSGRSFILDDELLVTREQE